MTKIDGVLTWLDSQVNPGEPILCATSGGLDSMCLAYLLHQSGYPIVVAHYHHGLRAQADGDAQFVERWCQERELPFVMERGDVADYAKTHGLGTEEAGRTLRYDFFHRLADSRGCRWIATAHHGDDNVETMLLNLCRGTGLAGLCGIPAVSGRIIRPLLSVSRADLEAYAQEQGLSFVIDHTNADEAFARNRLRHQVLPVLQSINGQAVSHFTQTAQQLTQENAYLTAQAQAVPRTKTPVGLRFLWPDLQVEPVLARRAIHQAICQVAGHSRDITNQHVEAVLTLGGQAGQVSLPYGLVAKSTMEQLAVEKVLDLPAQLPLVVEKTTVFGQWVVELSTKPTPEAMGVHLPAGTLCVTPWHSRDKLGSRTLKRRFVDCNITPSVRDTLPVVRYAGQAVAVARVGANPDFITSREGTSLFYITFTYKGEFNNG